MADELQAVGKGAGNTESAAARAGLSARAEESDFRKQIEEEQLGRSRQDREERKVCAQRIFLLVAVWLAAIGSLLVLQGAVGPHGRFDLSDSVLISVATATAASVTTLLVVVVRSLCPGS